MKLKMLLLGIGLGLVLTGCSQVATAEKPPLKIAWSAWPGRYPVVLAEEWDIFEQRGLKVELLPYSLASDVVQEYAAGKADGALLTGYDVLPINARPGDSSPIILITDNALAADAVVATSGIRTPVDLKGKTIGVKFGSYAEVLINTMLKDIGLSASDV